MKKAKSATPKAPRRPVSEKFYDEIIHRVAVTVCNNLDQPKDVIQRMKLIINAYLDRGDKPTKAESPSIRLMFSLLQPEIDKAISRSASARRRAALRREAKKKSCDESTAKSEAAPSPQADNQFKTTPATSAEPSLISKESDATSQAQPEASASHPAACIHKPKSQLHADGPQLRGDLSELKL